MAPSGGGKRRIWMVLALVLLLLVHTLEAAVVAQVQYFMDSRTDCLSTGIQDLPRDQTTVLLGRSTGSAGGNQLSCLLQFAPQTKGDTLKVVFDEKSYIEDPDVQLSVDVQNAGGYNYGSLSVSKQPVLEAIDGVARIQLTRTGFDDTNFYLRLTVSAERSVEKESSGSSSSDDVGLIVGIIAGVIAILIIAACICICCRRRRQNEERKRAKPELKQDLTKESLSTSVSGYENKVAKNGRAAESADESPSSDRRLLGQDKSQSALDRFGPPSQRKRQNNSREQEPERRYRGNEERDHRSRRDQYDYEERHIGDRRRDEPRDDRRRDDELRDDRRRRGDYEEQEVGVQRPPLLADLQENPRFRRSFNENQADAQDRARRISGSLDNSQSSSVSVDSNGVPLRPKLPPVPKSPPRSPSPQRRGEKIAGIFRARPSSSSSEVARLDGGPESQESGPSSAEDQKLDNQHGAGDPGSDKKKPDARHTLRPDRGNRRRDEERKPREEERRDRRRPEEDDDSEEERKQRREMERRKEERARRRQQEEEEEEEEARRRRKEEDRKKKRAEERRREEEEEEEKERRRKRREKERQEEKREREREEDKKEYEGRFKKSASGRRSKGKSPRMGRSRSTGNALEEMESNYQRSRSKSPSSVRSLNFIEDDDDDDLDSNYMPFRRAGSKTSLYASRSSLYGRRRKNSMGETMSVSSSYAYDDVDSRMGDFDKGSMSHRDKERMFRSTGDLEMRPASAQVVRECATQTGSERAVYVFGRRTHAKGRVGKRYSRGTQTARATKRRDSVDSTRSGRSSKSRGLKSKSKSQESLSRNRRSHSRDLDDDDDDDDRSERSRRHGRSRSRDIDYSDEEGRRRKHRSKSRGLEDDEDYDDNRSKSSRSKPRHRSRKSTGTASVDLSDSADDFDDDKSGVTSSVAPSSLYGPTQQPAYGPQFVPTGYPVAYTPAGIPYQPIAPGGPPLVIPAGAVPLPQPQAGSQRPPVAPKPNKSKWDQLVEITDGEKQRRRQYGDSVAETESVLSSSYGVPQASGKQIYYAPPSYTTAQRMPDPNSTFSSTYPDSSPRDHKQNHSSIYTPSESNI